MISATRLDELLEQFSGLCLALVGDLFLDRYLELAEGVYEESVETGLEAYQVARVRNRPGALGTVINNLAALGVTRLLPLTVIGCDGHGDDLLRELAELPVDTDGVLRSRTRLTPTYTKPLRRQTDGVWQELNRLDVRTRTPLDDDLRRQLHERLEPIFAVADGLIVLDQVNEPDWGVVTATLRGQLDELAARFPEKLVLVDSRARLSAFRSGTLKGNAAEVAAAGGVDARQGADLRRAVAALARTTERPAFCTVGSQGILVAQSPESVHHVAGCPVRGEVDIVGAGDAATAGIVCSLLAGADPLEAAHVANLVASITVQQIGTTGTATPAQVRQRHRECCS